METATSLASSFWSLCHQKRLVIAVAFTWLPAQALREEEEEEEEMKLSRRKPSAMHREREREEKVEELAQFAREQKGSEISKQPKGLLQDR